MFHELIRIWFGWVATWGYAGVFVLMVFESSVVPVPAEIVIPPAAFWAAQGKMSMVGVIAIGTAGSYVGSALNYWLSSWIGMPVLRRYGKFVFLPPSKLELGHQWVSRFGAFGIFTARLLPVVRHLISIPAGVLRMPFFAFSVATVIGAGLWSAVLCWFGREVIGAHPELLQSPEALSRVMKEKLLWFVLAAVIMAVLYGIVVWFKRKTLDRTPQSTAV